jgi:hypothetical protein
MSIALHQQVKQLERDLLEVSRALTDTQSLVKDLAQRLGAIEGRTVRSIHGNEAFTIEAVSQSLDQAMTRRKPGPKPRNG